MGNFLKDKIQKKIHDKYERQYRQQLLVERDSYATYIKENESEEMQKMLPVLQRVQKEEEVLFLPTELFKEETLRELLLETNQDVNYVVFLSGKGFYSKEAAKKVRSAFADNPGECILYANEDEIEESGKRFHPWFKPGWSPHTLWSFFYFGNFFAVRKETLLDYGELKGSDYRERIYRMMLELTKDGSAFLLNEVLYHNRAEDSFGDFGWEEKYNALKTEVLQQESLALSMEKKCKGEISYPVFLAKKEPKISILIPSKDHPEVLKRCVESLRNLTEYSDYEIIVVDNGSSEDNKKKYLTYGEKFSYSYLYSPMEFNFSKMCNLAAKNATGELFLLLNDDMEILEGDWLKKLAGSALLPKAGAVGAKLLYPGTDLIQHVGITNMYEGPVHKLMKHSDAVSYDHGRNRFVMDVIGVTAACLMVTREKFLEAGGLNTELAVAYNDVDFCFTLHEKGYYNLIRNDVVLYHHESLSRGNDLQEEGKRKRLLREGEMLYALHPEYYDFDPYYNKYFTGVSEEYACVLPYENRNIKPCEKITLLKGRFPLCERNETLIIKIDHAKYMAYGMQGEKPSYLIDLHAHVRGLDSCDYRYRMVLKGENGCYEVPAKRRLRPDVEKTIDNEKHVELSGFVVKIPEGMLPVGEYEIWMEAKSVYSRQILCNFGQETLKVER